MAIQHIHCPVNGYNCPSYSNNGHLGICLLDSPIQDCGDFKAVWDEDNDFIDDDWEDEEEIEDKYTLDDLGNNWW